MSGDGKGAIPENTPVELFSRACDEGWMTACQSLAAVYLQGQGIPVTLRARTALEKACSAGIGSACSDLGLMHYSADGVPLDKRKGLDYLKRACDAQCAGREVTISNASSTIGRRAFTRILALGLPLFGSAACAARAPRQPASVPDFVALIERVSPSVVAIGDNTQTLGSGFAVGPNLVLTAAHVARAAGTAAVVTSSAGRQAARIIGTLEESDVALLEIAQALPPLRLAATIPKVGEWIVVVGNPFGAGTTATVGIVSAAPGAIAATPELARQIQIDASVNPGNSGGPVCNLRGEVVAATTTLVAGGQGIAFATSASVLRSFLASLRK